MPLPTRQDFINGKEDLDALGEMVNSPDDKLVDTRFGGLKRTLANWEARWAEAIANAGGVPVGDGNYTAGKTYTNYNHYLVDNGTPYRAVTIPYTVDTTTYPNAAGDPNLRPWVFPGELANSRSKGFLTLDAALAVSYLQDGDLVEIAMRQVPYLGGHNLYRFVTGSYGTHDNGSIIDHQNSGGQLVALFPAGANFLHWGAVAGAEDNTIAIQAALNSGLDIKGVAGEFICSPLTISNKMDLELQRGCTLKLKDSSSGALLTIAADGVRVFGAGTLDGNAANQTKVLDTKHCIDIGNSNGVYIGGGLRINNASGSAVRGTNANNLHVSDVTIDNPGYIGIFIGNAAEEHEDILFENVRMTITDTRHKYVGIKVHTENVRARQVRYDNCSVIRNLEGGAHDGASASGSLADSGASWVAGEWVGWVVLNVTDGSYGTISANTGNTITATLAGGTNNAWNPGDEYEITIINQVGVETKYCDGVQIDNAISQGNAIGVSTVYTSSECQINSPVVYSRSPVGIGVEGGSGNQININNPVIDGGGALRNGIQVSSAGGSSQAALNVSNPNILGCSVNGIDYNGTAAELQSLTISGGIVQSRKVGINVKLSSAVVLDGILVDAGTTPVVLDKSVGVDIRGLKQRNTQNGNTVFTIVRLYADQSGFVVDDISLDGVTVQPGDGGTDGENILGTAISGGATLGENIRSVNNSKGYEVLRASSGSTDLSTALVSIKMLGALPASKAILSAVEDGSTACAVAPTGAANIGLWVKESGGWAKK